MDTITIILRLTITFVLSSLFGIDRKKSHKTIGFGTFILISLGSCGFAIVAMSLNNTFTLLGAAVTGVGFLGAGALIRTPDKAFGFTTAASIWVFAIFGLIIGIGEYITGITIYALMLVVIFLDKHIDKIVKDSYRRKITINTNKIVDEKEIESFFDTKKYIMTSTDVDKKNNRLSATYIVYGKKECVKKIPKIIMKQKWVDSTKIE